MFSRRRHRSRPGSAVAIGAVLSLALAAPLLTPPATAAVGGEVAAVGTLAARGSGVLSGRLVELARPAVAAASDHTRAQALSLPVQGPGALLTDAADRVLVELQLTDTETATVAALARIGEIVNVNPAAGRATVRIRPDRLEQLDSVGAVRYADLVPAPISGSSLPRTAATVGAAGSSRSRCRALSSEADTQLHARKARKAYGEDGSGVTVGVLSDSYDTADAATDARADIASGDLPGPGNPCGRLTPVDVVADYHPNPNDPGDTVTDEGRAMLQGIHDLAPGAGLAFATANDGPDAFAANIRRLARTGASVIVDDITYLTEPFFQSGVIDNAVHKVTEKYGVTYLSSAGNTNVDLAGRSVASWEDPKTSLTDCPALTLDPHQYGPLTSCVSFGTTLPDSGYQLRIAPGGSVLPVVQWAEPVGGVSDDFDVFLVDATTNKVLAGSAGDQARSQTPVEYFGWRNDSATTRNVKIVIPRYSGTGNPRLKISFVTLQGLVSMEYDRSAGANVVGPTIFGHNGGADTISVAAVPYDNPHEVEPYSALGPVTHYFGAVRGSGKPASPLAAPAVISAPTIAATDGTATTFFGDRSGGFWRFYGTSAAAPNAAAVVALVRALNPSLSPAQVRAVLRSTARRVGSSRPTAVGSGLVDARRAVGYVAAPVAPRLTRTKAKTGAVRIRFTPTPQPRIAPTVAYAAKCASSDGGAARRVRRAGTSTAAITVGGLTRGKHYRCKVRADTALASGRYSPKGAVVVPRGVPGRPRHVVVEPRPAAVKVTFRAPTNTGGRPITTYAARCTPVDGGRARARTGPTTELRVRHLRAGVGYRCAVTATNSRGTGPSSAMSRRVVPLR